MFQILKKVVIFLNKHYIVFLFLVLSVSYGQILRMYVWQDDNALFFKLAHLEGRAGYLGAGPLGDGPYKYTAAFYIPIYKLFGFNTTPYFIFTFLFYFLATLVIYKIISKIWSIKAGKIASAIYASGYIASDGYIRLFNSIITSLSVIFLSLLTLGYVKFIKTEKIKWYLLSLFSFWGALEFARARTHYLIAIIILFEIINIKTHFHLKKIIPALLRLLPFVFLFYRYFVQNADQRSGQVKSFLVSLLKGEWHLLYGFFSSLGNLLFPDWISRYLAHKALSGMTWIMALGVLLIFTHLVLKKRNKYLKYCFFTILITWTFISQKIFIHPLLDITKENMFVAYLGGVGLIFLSEVWLIMPKYKLIYGLFFAWFVLNIAAYSAYSPTVVYESVNRYFAHSIFALSILFGLIAISIPKYKALIFSIIAIYFMGNLLNAYSYQNRIIQERSDPAREFYRQLKEYVPVLDKGDIFYFDVADNARGYFQDSFSVAQMPETTAIAWRYGVDRYDLKMFTEFSKLQEELAKSPNNLGKLHAFNYSKSGLVNVTDDIKKAYAGDIVVNAFIINKVIADNGEVSFNINPKTITPLTVEVTIQASPKIDLMYPFGTKMGGIWEDKYQQKIAIDYKRYIEEELPNFKYSASSSWQDRVPENAQDNDPNTLWQADRIKWNTKKEAYLQVELPKTAEINRIEWMNAYGSYTPQEYQIQVSQDNQKWQTVSEVHEFKGRIEPNTSQIVKFDNVKAKYIRMYFTKTLNNDSPAISLFYPLPSNLAKLNLQDAKEYLANPYRYIESNSDFQKTLASFSSKGLMQILWLTNKSAEFKTNTNSQLQVYFDNKIHTYKIVIPSGGTELSRLQFRNIQIPGNLNIIEVKTYQETLNADTKKN